MNTTDVLLVIFVALAALALVGQFIVVFGVARVVRRLADRLTPVLPQLEQSARALPGMVREFQGFIAETRPRVQTVMANLTEISTVARDQARRFDGMAGDFTERLELQMVRVDEAIGTALASFEQITTSLRKSVLRPVQDAHALVQGIRTGLDFFFRRRSSPAPRPAYQDEEMFI